MYEYTNRLKLPLLVPNQSGKEITHNEAMVIIDNLLQNHVISKSLNTPPNESLTGDIYIVADNGINDWLDKDEQLAIFDNGWRFVGPINGMMFYILDENCFYVYNGEWLKLESVVDITKLKNININNLQNNDVLKYDGINIINSRELNLLKLYINDKLLIDEDLNISSKDGENLKNLISITDTAIDFKENIKIDGTAIDNYIINTVNTGNTVFLKNDLSNITELGQTSIENIVGENTALKDLSNIDDLAKTTLHNLINPDWSRLIGLSGATEYTFEEDGYLMLWGGSDGSDTSNIYIGYKSNLDTTDNKYTYILVSIQNTWRTNQFIVQKGETIVKKVSRGTVGAYFLPLKNN